MPRPRSSPDRLRSAYVTARVRPDQRRKLARLARASGRSMSDCLSDLINGQALMPSMPPVAEIVPSPLLAHWQRVGNNLNQIARSLNRGREPKVAWIVGAVAELMALMIADQLTRRHAQRFGHADIDRHLARA